MSAAHDDIKLFRQLREQLAPVLSKENAALWLRIEKKLTGSASGEDQVPAFKPIKKAKALTHKERVRMFL